MTRNVKLTWNSDEIKQAILDCIVTDELAKDDQITASNIRFEITHAPHSGAQGGYPAYILDAVIEWEETK